MIALHPERLWLNNVVNQSAFFGRYIIKFQLLATADRHLNLLLVVGVGFAVFAAVLHLDAEGGGG